MFLIIPVLCIGMFIGMKEMLISIIMHTGFSFLVSATVSGKLINYRLTEYVLDILKPAIFSLLMFFIVNLIQDQLDYGYFYELIISVVSGVLIIVICYELSKNKEYEWIKQIVFRHGNVL
jgi:hypothetical protein